MDDHIDHLWGVLTLVCAIGLVDVFGCLPDIGIANSLIGYASIGRIAILRDPDQETACEEQHQQDGESMMIRHGSDISNNSLSYHSLSLRGGDGSRCG